MGQVDYDPGSVQSRNTGKVIIGVDDTTELLYILRLYVEDGGYSFVGASSGEECIGLTYKVRPRLIILDVRMPNIDGFETCRRLRLNRELSQVPIMFLTGHHTSDDVHKGLRVGGNDFIVKPFKREELMGRINHWSSRRVGSVV